MKNDYFFNVPGDTHLGVQVNFPLAAVGEHVHGLPPYAPVRGSLVDCYPGCPADWPRSTGNLASYFIPIVEGRGMWLDFNACWAHRHQVAVVVSIQGVNPLTGRKADKLELESYPDDSSVDKWLRGRQNYLATTSTPDGMLWIDGFRAKDGTVRQYIFTKEERKGVAAQLIGVDRVFAIGAAFFLSKEPKPERPRGSLIRGVTHMHSLGDFGSSSKGLGLLGCHGPSGDAGVSGSDVYYAAAAIGASEEAVPYMRSLSTKKSFSDKPRLISAKATSYSAESIPTINMVNAVAPVTPTSAGPDMSLENLAEADAATFEIAAGAEIDQVLHKDTVALDYWQAKCAGIVAISYCPVTVLKKILAAGRIAEPEGFLEGLEVGNK